MLENPLGELAGPVTRAAGPVEPGTDWGMARGISVAAAVTRSPLGSSADSQAGGRATALSHRARHYVRV